MHILFGSVFYDVQGLWLDFDAISIRFKILKYDFFSLVISVLLVLFLRNIVMPRVVSICDPEPVGFGRKEFIT